MEAQGGVGLGDERRVARGQAALVPERKTGARSWFATAGLPGCSLNGAERTDPPRSICPPKVSVQPSARRPRAQRFGAAVSLCWLRTAGNHLPPL